MSPLMLQAMLARRTSRVHIKLPQPKPDSQALAHLAQLAEAGTITPVIDRTFTLEDAVQALHYIEVDHARAKVIVRM